MEGKYCYNKKSMELPFWEEKTKTRQDERMVKLEKKIQNAVFGPIFKNKQHIHFLVHGRSSF